MKLIQIYSNKSLQNINFSDSLNVILAEVHKPDDANKDSHNLGKTSLIELIDFLLLKKIDKNHTYKKNYTKFKGYCFFLEIKNNKNDHLTIARSIDEPNYIYLKFHSVSQNFLNDTSFYQAKFHLDEAKKHLENFLNFNAFEELSFRDTLTYFLRSQKDYLEVFQLSKNQKSKDIDWKPLIFKMLGFASKSLIEKYELDDNKKELRKSLKKEESKSSFKKNEIDKIKGLIDIKASEKKLLETKLDNFNFEENEIKLKHELAQNIETEINELNISEYNLTLEEDRIEQSLDKKIEFDLAKCEQIFNESKIYFGEQIKKDYQELIVFNQKVVTERHNLLHERKKEIISELKAVKNKLSDLNLSRSKLLSFLKEGDSFKKFKNYQRHLEDINLEIAKLNENLKNIDQMDSISADIEEVNKKLKDLRKNISDNLKKGDNDLYSSIRLTFSKIVSEVLGQPGIISMGVNTAGNVYFEANIQDPHKLELTEQGKGTTYKKILCAAFDLAIIINYSKKSYFRFVYHDGVFEGLDNRMKARFYECIKRLAIEHNIQYIFTAIQDDLIRDKNGKIVNHPELHIALKLHDEGPEGKLFLMDY